MNIRDVRNVFRPALRQDASYLLKAAAPKPTMPREVPVWRREPESALESGGAARDYPLAKLSEQKKLTVMIGAQRRSQKEYVETINRIQEGVLANSESMNWASLFSPASPRSPCFQTRILVRYRSS